MASPQTRQQLIDYCLRRLGHPVIEINVDVDQIEDKVDDCLQVYQEFHSDATHRTYLEHQVTADDITNGYIPISADILYLTKMFPVDSSFVNSTNMFSFRYQFALSDYHSLATWSSGQAGLQYYTQMRQYLELIDMTLNGTPQVTFSRHQDRLYIWGDIEDKTIAEGDWVAAECYVIIDPEVHTSIYNDIFVKDYTTALIKQQWGQNMKKFEGMQLPGGVQINGQVMFDEATQQLVELRERLRLEYEFPTDFFVG